MSQDNGFECVRQAIHEAFLALSRRYDLQSDAFALATGIRDLDALIGGFERGSLVVLAGRPGVGKTTLLLKLAAHTATFEFSKVAFHSSQLTPAQVGSRLLAIAGDLPVDTVRFPRRLAERDWPRLTDAVAIMGEKHLWLRCTPVLELDELCACLRQQHLENPFSLAIVDGLQQARLDTDGADRRAATRDALVRLKRLALELNAVVLASCGLPPFVDTRRDKAPILADLGDWQPAEDFADMVMFLHREPGDADLAHLRVALNRHGGTGAIRFQLPGHGRKKWEWTVAARWIAPRAGERFGALVLANEDELFDEGSVMENCLAAHAEQCHREGCRILSIREHETAVPIANAEISPGEAGNWTLKTVLGPANTEPSPEAVAAAQWAVLRYAHAHASATQGDDAEPSA